MTGQTARELRHQQHRAQTNPNRYLTLHNREEPNLISDTHQMKMVIDSVFNILVINCTTGSFIRFFDFDTGGILMEEQFFAENLIQELIRFT